MELNFCNNDCDLFKTIPQLYVETILSNIPIETIQGRYDDMRANFNKVEPLWNTINGYEPNEYGDLAIPISNLKFSNLSKAINLGLDLPTWFNYGSNKPSVMILAMEPLRSPNEPYSDFITLASPFALHYKNIRNKLPYSTTFKFIQQLVADNLNVYLTDIYKLYSLVNAQKYTGEKELNRAIFKQELEIVKPEYVVVFGKTAQNRLKEFDGLFDGANTRIIYLCHPSAFGGNKHFFSEFKRLKNSA